MISRSWKNLSLSEGKRVEALGCIPFLRVLEAVSLARERELGVVLLRHKAFISQLCLLYPAHESSKKTSSEK